MQEAAYASLPKRARQERHRRVAETIEAQFPRLAETRPEVVAEHYAASGARPKAVDFYLRAGERARSQGATLEAKNFFDRAYELLEPGDHERRWRVLDGREATLNMRAERKAQKQDIDELRGLAEVLDDDMRRAEAELRQMHWAAVCQDYVLSLGSAEAVRAAAGRAGNLVLEVRALAGRLAVLNSLGDWDDAGWTTTEILAKLPGIADEAVRAYALTVVGLYHRAVRDLDRAVATLRQAAEAARRVGDRRIECRTNANIALTCTQLGLYAQAQVVAEEALALAAMIGDRDVHAHLTSYLSYMYWRTGDRKRAQVLGEAARQAHAASASVYGQAECQAYLGYYLEDAGDPAAAEVHLGQAAVGFAAIGAIPEGIEPLAAEARCLLTLGRRDEARELATRVCARLRERGNEGIDFPARVYLCLADVAAGIPELGLVADEVVQTGYRDLVQCADKIGNEEWRRSFLDNVPENRALLARWRECSEH